MWPFKNKTNSIVNQNVVQQPSQPDQSVQHSTYDISQTSQAAINQVCHESEQSNIEERMMKFLRDRGYDVTPSGTPVSMFKKAKDTVVDTGVDGFHIARGITRKVKGAISDKLEELKNAGT